MADLPAISEIDDTEAVRVVIFTNGQQVHVPLNTLLQERSTLFGPASSTDGGFAKFDGTTGQLLKDSPAVIAIADGGTGQTTAAAAFNALKQAATTSATGAVELATDAEAIAKTDTARALTPSNLASQIHVDAVAGHIPFPADGTYRLFIDVPFGFTVSKTTTICDSGTCTATFKNGTTALGGTANSVSSTEQQQTHSSANVFAVGDDLALTISANSSCVGMAFTVTYTRAV
jgi:hypothetical protein